MDRTLRTDRLVLRPFRERDLQGYLDYYCSDDRTAGVGGAKPKYVVIERFYAMEGQWAIRGFGRYAIALDDASPAIGHTGVMCADTPPEMTWTLWDDSQTGKGYATEAAKAAMDAYLTHVAPRVIAVIDRDNAASLRVAGRLGMTEDTDAVAPHWMPNGRCFVAEATA